MGTDIHIYIYIYMIWDCYWIATRVAIRLLFGLRLDCLHKNQTTKTQQFDKTITPKLSGVVGLPTHGSVRDEA